MTSFLHEATTALYMSVRPKTFENDQNVWGRKNKKQALNIGPWLWCLGILKKFNISYTAIFATTITRQSKFESYTLWQYCNIDEYIFFFSLSLLPQPAVAFLSTLRIASCNTLCTYVGQSRPFRMTTAIHSRAVQCMHASVGLFMPCTYCESWLMSSSIVRLDH